MLLTFEQFKAFQPEKPTFALFGWPLGHTMSPELHAALFATDSYDADYIAVAVPPEDLREAFYLAKEKLGGINLTIPHKKAVISMLDEADPSARALGSVNTVSFTGRISKGFNTDILGFASSLELDGIKLSGKKVLLLGYGGAAAVMGYHCALKGAWVHITGRNMEKAESLCSFLQSALPDGKIHCCSRKHIPKDIQIVLNATPLGMFPNEEECPLRFLPRKTEYVFDAIYNPPITSTMLLAKHVRKARARDGLHMLVMQAAHAQTIWTDRLFTKVACDSILRSLYGKMAAKRLHEKHGKENIVLCGFMGSGKTTAGKKIARITDMEFIDADQYLEEKEGMKIPEIFAKHGEPYFRDLETKYLKELTSRKGIVLALGGGAILRPENVNIMRETGLIIHLDTPFYRILKNISFSTNRPLLEKGDKEAQTRKLYNSRKHIYRCIADRSVRSPRISEVVERVVKSI